MIKINGEANVVAVNAAKEYGEPSHWALTCNLHYLHLWSRSKSKSEFWQLIVIIRWTLAFFFSSKLMENKWNTLMFAVEQPAMTYQLCQRKNVWKFQQVSTLQICSVSSHFRVLVCISAVHDCLMLKALYEVHTVRHASLCWCFEFIYRTID